MKQTGTMLALASAAIMALSAPGMAEPGGSALPPSLDFLDSGAIEELAPPIDLVVPEVVSGSFGAGFELTMVDIPDLPISEAAPEPSALALLAAFLAGFAVLGRRRRYTSVLAPVRSVISR